MVYCLFEQSGTFRDFFRSLGFDAVDVDIMNQFGKTDVQIDLFEEIGKSDSWLYRIQPEDFVLCFFPCTCFSTQFNLELTATANQYQQVPDIAKIDISQRANDRRNSFYKKFCRLYTFFIENGIRAVIENPYHDSWLYKTFPIKPTVIILDRRKYGDKFRKPTMFYFVNFVPDFNLQMPYVVKENVRVEDFHGIERSLIKPEFVKSFFNVYLKSQFLPKN